MSLSVVIPAYRATSSLRMLTEQLTRAYPDTLKEIVIVFDDGRKETWNEIEALVVEFPAVVGVRLNRNFGQHNATICGFNYCTGELIATLDEDLQHHPEDVAKLMAHQRTADFDVVYGAYADRQHDVWRNITSSGLKTMLRVGLPGLHGDYTSFRLLTRKVAHETTLLRNSYTFLDGYLTWITSNVSSCEIGHHESSETTSSYSVKKLVAHTFNILFNFTDLPIRVLTILSVVTLLASTSYGTYTVIRAFLQNDQLIGFPTLVALLGFGFGIVLLGLTVLVQYIARINEKTTNRPSFVVKEVVR